MGEEGVTTGVADAAAPGSADVDVVIMAKRFAGAKSRLSDLPDRLRRELCRTMLCDTVAAIAPTATRIVVVSDQPGLAGILALPGILVVPDPGGGLNPAVRSGESALGPAREDVTRIAVVADLPCLRVSEFAAIVTAASQRRASFVADAEARGTSMLAAHGGTLDPRFGPDSAQRHRAAGAVPLQGRWPGARRDVDTPTDLDQALRMGVGPETAALFGAATVP